MKRILVYLTLLIAWLGSSTVYGQSKAAYYYYKGEKIPLQINKNRIAVVFNGDRKFKDSLEHHLTIEKELAVRYGNKQVDNNAVLIQVLVTDSTKYESTIEGLNKMKQVFSVNQVIGYSEPKVVSPYFFVQVKSNEDSLLLAQTAASLRAEVMKPVPYSKNWFQLQRKGNNTEATITICNQLSETGLFQNVDYGFMYDFSNKCVSDTMFYSDQWGINGSAASIYACNAWNVTKGSNSVIVAVIDEGIENSHSEFVGNAFSSLSFDALSGTSPAQLYGTTGHGTHVYGIISANHHVGAIAGVAPNVTGMEISHSMVGSLTISAELASGINFAANNGAAVINNSWGDQGGNVPPLHSTILETAIDNALINGRSGLGTVVVFATGNYGTLISGRVDYPASYRPEILAVGSIGSTGLRSPYSNWGSEIDIVAPGEGILSSTLSNTLSVKNGTSMAAPHASSVAALLLSKYPNLTRQEVVEAIESSTQKIQATTYTYAITGGRTNGTWNSEMGYGLLNAPEALRLGCIVQGGITIHSGTTFSTNTNLNACALIRFTNVTVQSGVVLNVQYGRGFEATGTLNIAASATVDIRQP